MRLLKYISAVAGGILIFNSFASAMVANFHFGVLATFFAGVSLLLFGLFAQKLHKWQKIVFASLVVAVLAASSALVIYGSHDNASYTEDAIIVLGAGVRGDEVGPNLKSRLDAALECRTKNSDAIIIVSGGQGPQENITEGLAMEEYLVAHGVPHENIIREERSTSTSENFRYSKVLSDVYFDGGEYSLCLVTNEYHVFRAQSIAKKEGFADITHIHSDTSWHSLVPGVLRECLAVIKLWIFGY